MFYSTRSKWLFDESTAIFPSLYIKYENMNAEKRAKFMQGRMVESMRMVKMSDSKKYVYPYTWIKYYDTKQFVDKVIRIYEKIINYQYTNFVQLTKLINYDVTGRVML